MVETNNIGFPMMKEINNDQSLGGENYHIAVSMWRNVPEIGILLPDGGFICLDVNSIHELEIIESQINYYESPN